MPDRAAAATAAAGGAPAAPHALERALPATSPTLIPKARYTSPSFAALEARRLWPRVWQIACTVDHVAEPGDWFEYRAGRLSVIVVRGEDGELRAFQNACRHRGNAICRGSGSGAKELRCPYHRWSWDLHGRLRGMPSREYFGALRSEEFPLFGVRVGSWGRLVFVNLDANAMPLDEFLEGVPADAAWARLDEMRCVVTTATPIDANWKVIADGFSETYHIQGLHHEMLGSIDDVGATQRLWGHCGVSYQDYGVASPRLGERASDQVVWDSWVTTQGPRMGPEYAKPCPLPPLAPGQTIRDAIAQKIREHHRATFGADLSGFDTRRMLRLSQYNLFPNATVLVWGEMVNVLLARPGPTPDRGELASFLLYRAPSADAPRTRPADLPVPATGDFGFVLNQDVSILASMQVGLAQPGLTHVAISNEECRVLNLHRNLERYLGIGPDEPREAADA
jgi:phenylpropionate dioxygenase-like ring-hydroxylating dioxygenase large terminal subunit